MFLVVVAYEKWNKLGHWYTDQLVIYLFSAFCLTMIKTMIPPENKFSSNNQHSLKGSMRTQVSAFVFKAIYSNNTSIYLQGYFNIRHWPGLGIWLKAVLELFLWNFYLTHSSSFSRVVSSSQKWEAYCKTAPLFSECDLYTH